MNIGFGIGIPFRSRWVSSALTFGVTLSSVVGGLPTSGSGIVSINQVAPAITPVIAVSRSTGVAPLAVTFDALGTTAPALTSLPFSEIYYAWTFGDPAGGAAWAYGTRPGVNLKNEAIGPVAAHVFETHSASPYTVTCWAFYLDSGGTLHSGSSTTSITVTNPDTVFSGTNTICISQNSTPIAGQDGAPAGCAVQQVTSWSAVQGLASTYKRILLKRGDVWPNEGGITIGASQAGPGLIGAYGTGNKPVITNGNIRIETPDWRVVDLFFTGATQDERTWSSGLNTRPGCVDALFLRTDVRWCFELTSFVGSTGVYLVDGVVGLVSDQANDARGYANWTADVSRIAFLGTRFHGSNAHTVRWQGVDTAVFSNSTVEEPKGPASWSMLTIRGKANSVTTGVWNGLWTENVVVSDTYIASGPPTAYATFSVAPMNAESAERLRNVIVERNHVVSLGSEAMIFAVSTGLTVRNNILQSLNSTALSLFSQSTAGTPDSTQGFIYNNTLYRPNASVWPSSSAIAMQSRVTGQVIRNNIAYAPGSTSPTMFGGAAVEGTNYTQSNNSSNAQVLSNRPWASATPVVAADFTPSASYAVDGGTWVPVYKNYFGTTASGTREIGAI